MSLLFRLTTVTILLLTGMQTSFVSAQAANDAAKKPQKAEADWTQWRGPNRDGKIKADWPDSLKPEVLKKTWTTPLGPSYSGPLVIGDYVYVTETRDSKYEVVQALNRKDGKVAWTSQWEGAMRVPFFAAANGSWIRSTPTYEDGKLYVAGMRDVVVCLDAKQGDILWKVDFPKKIGSAVPSFGFVCSPLVDGDFVYVQAGGALTKLNKKTGDIVWQGMKDGGGMNGGAFSSPVIAEIAGKRQGVVLTRNNLCGVDLGSGEALWKMPIKAFRGMNILTPTIFGDNVFTSTYGGTTQLINVASSGGAKEMTASEKWNVASQGYMTSPVIIDGHAYIHLKNQRFACFDLEAGVEKWRSKTFGKYSSLVAAGDKILALDQRGELLLIKANTEEFELLDRRKVGDDSWAHIAVSGKDVVVRDFKEVSLFKWNK